jgi:hypothetical protein
MDNQKKKRAAAISAVMAYIKSEEEALCMRAAAAAPAAVGAGPLAPVNLWGVSGRQAMMQMRNLMQMKTFHGTKFQ